MADKRYYLVVRAIIRDSKGRCLLIRRSNVCHKFVGKWEWPGGKVDKGESFDVALRREVREEIGLKVELVGVVGAYGKISPKRIAVLCLEARPVGGTVRLSEEHDQYSWVALKDLHKWDMTYGLMELTKNYVAAKNRGRKNHG